MPEFIHNLDVDTLLRSPGAPDDAVGQTVQDSVNWITGPINDFVEKLTGRNIVSDVQDLFVGDWGCLYQIRDAVLSSGEALNEVLHHCSSDVGRLSEYWSGEAAATFAHFMQSRDQEIGKLAQALVDFHHLLSKAIKGMEDLCSIFVSRINDLANSVATGIAIAGAGGVGILVGGAVAGPFGGAAGGMIAEMIMEAVSAVYLIYDLIKTMIADIPKIIEAWQISSEVKSSDPAGGLQIGRPYGGS